MILVLILGIILFTFMARVISNTTYKKTSYQKPAEQQAANQTAAPLFLDSVDWNTINGLQVTPVEKTIFKTQLLKLSLEASIINGRPLITPTVPLYEYLNDIDAFYSQARNAKIPLYFAIKIADMKRSGASQAVIEGYRTVLVAKLEKAGLIKK